MEDRKEPREIFKTEEDFKVLEKAIENPKGPNQALKDARDRYNKELELKSK